MSLHKRGSRGFTLIELTTVLAVIAVIAVMLTPSIANFMDQARLSSALNDGRALREGLDRYFLANNRYPSSGDISDYKQLRLTVEPWLDLPEDEAKASFKFDRYTGGGSEFELNITAKNSAGTPIRVTHRGVTY